MNTPIGLAITAIAAGALLIYKYWGPIKAFMSGMWSGFMDGLNTSKGMLGDFINSIQPLKPIWSWMVDKFTTFKGVLAEIVSPFQATTSSWMLPINTAKPSAHGWVSWPVAYWLIRPS